MGNLKVALSLKWKGADNFINSTQKQLKTDKGNMIGFIRGKNNFKYILIVDTGHLVPMFKPEAAAYMMEHFIKGDLEEYTYWHIYIYIS